MIDATDAAFLIAAEPEIGAAVRTMLIDHADHAAAVAEGEQFLSHDGDLLRRAVGFGQFLGQQNREPETAQQLAHPGPRAAFGQETVILSAEHGCPPGQMLDFGPAWRGRGYWSIAMFGAYPAGHFLHSVIHCVNPIRRLGNMGKYENLGAFLQRQRTREVPLTFREIEKITGVKLPP